jgi:hypothetical protein
MNKRPFMAVLPAQYPGDLAAYAMCRTCRHDLSFLTASQQLQHGLAPGLDSSFSCGSPSPPVGSPMASMRGSAVGLDLPGASVVCEVTGGAVLPQLLTIVLDVVLGQAVRCKSHACAGSTASQVLSTATR